MQKTPEIFLFNPAAGLCGAVVLAGLCACERLSQREDSDDLWQKKVKIDLAAIDGAGLRGPAGGKVCVAYEFVIPEGERFRAEVRALDASVRFMPGSRGRSGAGPGECLCVGETGPDFHTVLRNLAALPYIRKIVPCDFE